MLYNNDWCLGISLEEASMLVLWLAIAWKWLWGNFCVSLSKTGLVVTDSSGNGGLRDIHVSGENWYPCACGLHIFTC